MVRAAIIKYGVGNVYSVYSALRRAGAEPSILEGRLSRLQDYDLVILPGVGSYPAAMRRLREWGLHHIADYVRGGGALLGICLGMQLLFERSTEEGGAEGLGLLPGTVDRLDADKLPHIGWARVRKRRSCSLLEGIPDNTYFYFMHSYAYLETAEPHVCATAEHQRSIFAAVVEKPPVYGTQFHPERSSKWGQKLLRNLINTIRR